MSCHQAEVLPFQTEDRRIRRSAHSGSVLGDSLHDRLEVGRRACNDPQDLSGDGLLLERLCHLRVCLRERTVLLLQLLEQPHVLDGDHRLVGEGPEEGDMALRELTRLGSRHRDGADRVAITQHRHHELTAHTLDSPRLAHGGGDPRVIL